MKTAVAAQIAESRTLLDGCRNLLSRLRHDPPAELYDMLHMGADTASSLLGLVRDARRKGIIDDSTLMLGLQVANAWLTFDEEVEEVLATDLPAGRAIPTPPLPH